MAGFEELEVWKDSMRLAQNVYAAFDHSRDFGLRDQICRSAVSIPSNIAEGYERGSNKDFVRFLRIAMGSLAELRTQLYLAQRLSKADAEACGKMIASTKKLSAQINKLASYRLSQINK